jgi:hypothetical protein
VLTTHAEEEMVNDDFIEVEVRELLDFTELLYITFRQTLT